MKKNKLLIVVGAIIVLAVGSLLICRNHMDSTADGVVRVGAILPLTGDYADVGNWMKAGIQLALEDCSSNGTNRIEVIYEDSQGKANVGLNAYRKLKDMHNIKFYISTVTPVCLALRPQVMTDGNFMLVNAGHRDITAKNSPTIFRHALTMTQEAKFIANYVQKKHAIDSNTRFSFVYANNDIGLEVRDVFLQSIPKCDVSVYSYEESDKDLKNVSAKIASSKPEFIVICGYTKNLGILIRSLRESSYSKNIYVNQGFSTPSVRDSAGDFAYNVFYTDYDIPDSRGIIDLKRRIKERFASSLSTHNITAYNAIVIINNAVSADLASSPTPLQVADRIKAGAPYNINDMKLEINDIGDIYVPLVMVENKVRQK